MKRLRRLIFASSLITFLVSIMLLLNITAPNPTHRRYSSRLPLTTGQGSAAQIGVAGEQVLADDLRLPRNDSPDQLQCICNSPRTIDVTSCRVCMAYTQISSPYRRPDFVAPDFIAESKNAQNLYYDSRDLNQIGDFAIAARALGRPLWVFTRVNTNLDPEFERIVRSTGGDVVKYFAVPGYEDPVDMATTRGLLVGIFGMGATGLWGVAVRCMSTRGPRPSKQPKDPLGSSIDAVDHARNFAEASKDKVRRKLD